ncbi:MAG: hypothetical protein LBM87_00330 [Ruminococcus sp.]|jgi:hypothetical protein|nr:hypothetical protein [Ruminococcus sp.]
MNELETSETFEITETNEPEKIEITVAEYETLLSKTAEYETVEKKFKAALLGINPENIDDALTLANKYNADGSRDFDEVLSEITKKYPNLKKTQPAPVTTGVKTAGKAPVPSGVESAFLKRNPGIKI